MEEIHPALSSPTSPAFTQDCSSWDARLLPLAFLGKYWEDSKEKCQRSNRQQVWGGMKSRDGQSYGFALKEDRDFTLLSLFKHPESNREWL